MTTPTPQFDSRQLRNALGNFATGITVITTQHGTEKTGLTVNSFSSVSLDPPLVLWSLDKRSPSLELFKKSGFFAINILAADQVNLSNQFARSSADKFDQVSYDTSAQGTPILHDCSAVFECTLHDVMEGGDHWILIGRVIHFEQSGRKPLVSHPGGYNLVTPYPAQRAEADTRTARPELNDNLYYLLTRCVQKYQTSYEPIQSAEGLNTTEARILMHLHAETAVSKKHIAALMMLNSSLLEQSLEVLERKALVSVMDEELRLTQAGAIKSQRLHEIADQHEQAFFKTLQPAQTHALRQLLQHVEQV